MRFPLPPRKLELQRLLSPVGRPIYKDVDGVNEQDKYFIPDNVEGRKLRPIQTGRIFDFAGVEDITFTKNITSIIGWFDSGGGWDEAHNFSADISGAVFSPTGKVARLDVTFTDASKAFLYCDDQSGLVAHDALTEGGNDGVIDVDGSSESSFHATDPEVPSRQNEVGYNTDIEVLNDDFLTMQPWIDPTVPNGWTYFGTQDENTFIEENANGLRFYSSASLMGMLHDIEEDVSYRLTIDVYSITSGYVVILVSGVTTHSVDSVGVSVYEITGGITVGLKRATGGGDDMVIRSIKLENISYIPLAQDGDGKTDVLGNTVPHPYFGEVRKEALLTNASCMNFDGNLILTFSDLSGRSIVDQEGDVTLEISGNNIQPVSGTGVVWYLEFDNGSYYRGSEVNGLTVWDLNTANALDGAWDLLGSSDGDQYGDSEFARPNNVLDGFTPVTYATGDQHVPADPANPGFDVQGNALGVKGSTIAMNPCESKVIFNPYGDPGLHAMGLDDTIELGYADIVADESLFHDNRVANKVEKLLAYSDFQYPVLGSSFQSDGNITISHPSIATNGIVQFEGTAEYVINGDTLELTAGLIYILVVGDGTYTYFPEEKGLVVYDYAKSGINFTVNLNGSPDGDQWLLRSNKYVESGVNLNINLRYGRYDNGISLIPGDFANFGFDILGNPIDNMEEVIKYRRIRQFLRK